VNVTVPFVNVCGSAVHPIASVLPMPKQSDRSALCKYAVSMHTWPCQRSSADSTAVEGNTLSTASVDGEYTVSSGVRVAQSTRLPLQASSHMLHGPLIPPPHASDSQKLPSSAAMYSLPSGQRHVPPQAPTPTACSVTTLGRVTPTAVGSLRHVSGPPGAVQAAHPPQSPLWLHVHSEHQSVHGSVGGRQQV